MNDRASAATSLAYVRCQRLRIIPQTHLPPLLGGETNCYCYTLPIRAVRSEAMKVNQELFDGCGDPELWKQLDQTNDQLSEITAKNRELVSEISVVDRKAQNVALRAEEEMSRSDINRCCAQAVAFNQRAEELCAEMKALERSNKDLQSRRDQIEKQMRAW